MRRIWRWLTCGHGHHAWERRLGIDLAYEDQIGEMVVGSYCPRCGEITVEKTLTLKKGTVTRYGDGRVEIQVINDEKVAY